MVISREKLLYILETEAMRHRAQARLSDLAVHHLQAAEALELALRLVKTCHFDEKKGNDHEN